MITCNCAVCGSSDERNKAPSRQPASGVGAPGTAAGGRRVNRGSWRWRRRRTEWAGSPRTHHGKRARGHLHRFPSAGGCALESDHVDAVVYTHTHADHVLGLDELRIYNFVHKRSIPLYGSAESLKVIRRIFEYAFEPDARAVPQLTLHEIGDSVELFGARVHALPVRHGRFDVFGFRVGDFGYVTDCSEIPEAAAAGLTDLDVLVIDALRREPHPSHFSLDEALREIERLRPRYAYLTHLTHVFDHAALQRELPKGVDVAYDGPCA